MGNFDDIRGLRLVRIENPSGRKDCCVGLAVRPEFGIQHGHFEGHPFGLRGCVLSCFGGLQGTIDRNVSFRYPGSDRYIFKSLDLTVRKGEYVGIRGSSGIGKTTLFNIMMGFYFPEEGGVYIDGEKLTPDNVRSWQRQIGYVPQDIFLVNGTFVENIAFGVSPENVDRDRIDGILERVGLKSWTDSMSQGIDTQIAEAGNTVSGGQKQRLGIARALYKGASVLFFDEATSSVDAAAENEINAFIRELSAADGGLTVIVIAHRQETLDSCKRIIDIEKLPLRSRTSSATSPRRGG